MKDLKKILNFEVLVLIKDAFIASILLFVLLYFFFLIFVVKIDAFEKFKFQASNYIPLPVAVSNQGILYYQEYYNSRNLSYNELGNLMAEKIILKDYVGGESKAEKIEYLKSKKKNLDLYTLVK